MAKAKAAKATAEPRELKLVCKCGACTKWEIVLVREPKTNEGGYERSYEVIICVACGLRASCYFSIGPHEGLHYEKHVAGDEKESYTPSVAVQSANTRRNAKAL